MPEDMDNQLAFTMARLELSKSDKEILAEENPRSDRGNPFYEVDKITDINIWKKDSNVNQDKGKTIKVKNILRKPKLQIQSALKGRKGIQLNTTEMENQITWVNFKDIKKAKLKPSFSMNDLEDECHKVADEVGGLSKRNHDYNGFNEMMLHLDALFIPTRMSQMAENMYS